MIAEPAALVKPPVKSSNDKTDASPPDTVETLNLRKTEAERKKLVAEQTKADADALYTRTVDDVTLRAKAVDEKPKLCETYAEQLKQTDANIGCIGKRAEQVKGDFEAAAGADFVAAASTALKAFSDWKNKVTEQIIGTPPPPPPNDETGSKTGALAYVSFLKAELANKSTAADDAAAALDKLKKQSSADLAKAIDATFRKAEEYAKQRRPAAAYLLLSDVQARLTAYAGTDKPQSAKDYCDRLGDAISYAASAMVAKNEAEWTYKSVAKCWAAREEALPKVIEKAWADLLKTFETATTAAAAVFTPPLESVCVLDPKFRPSDASADLGTGITPAVVETIAQRQDQNAPHEPVAPVQPSPVQTPVQAQIVVPAEVIATPAAAETCEVPAPDAGEPQTIL